MILTSSGAVGAGVAGESTGDFGGGTAPTKIPSGAHYPQQASSVEAWANWYDTAGPTLATVNVDGTCRAMTLQLVMFEAAHRPPLAAPAVSVRFNDD